MKLALLGPIAWRTPPRHYGPWELVTGLLADGLAQRGVDVTLFATLDSITLARLDGICERPYEEDSGIDGRVWEALHVAHALSRSAEFDLIHNHLDWLPLAFAGLARAPMVTTIHGFSSPRILPAYLRSGSAFVSISDADRAPGLDYVATVHHGVDTTTLPFSARAGEGLVCFGRIHPDKGTAQAIKIARRAERPLVLCGPVQDERYFSEEIEPHVDGDRVRYLGSVGPADRAEVLGAATCLLHPIAFAEPFGLSVVESMLCGTPVVAYARGSMPELVDDGITGVLAHGVDSAVAGVERAAGFDRRACRQTAERRFSAGRMVDDYLEVYESILRDR
jgi:glycosyltransferase involved in cell wall biosynthesis